MFNKEFGVRILIKDRKDYEQVADYLKGRAIETGLYGDELLDKTYYIFDEQKKQVAKANKSKRTIELTKESSKIKKGIEEILYQTK